MKSFFTFWKNWSLNKKVIVANCIVSAIVVFISVTVALSGYKKEKLAHLLELHNARTEGLSGVVANWLYSQVNATNFAYSLAEPEISQSIAERISVRPPAENEVYWLLDKQPEQKKPKSYLLWQQNEKIVLKRASNESLRSSANEFSDINFAILNSDKDTLWLNGLSKKQADELLRVTKDAGLAKLQSKIEIWERQWVVTLQEIANSNLILLSAYPIDDLFFPLKKAFRILALLCVGIFFVGAIIQNWLILGFSKPLQQLAAFFEEIIEGRTPEQIVTFMPELKPVTEGANLMLKSIEHREKELRCFLQGQDKILTFLNSTPLFEDTNTTTLRVAQVCEYILDGWEIENFLVKIGNFNASLSKLDNSWHTKILSLEDFNTDVERHFGFLVNQPKNFPLVNIAFKVMPNAHPSNKVKWQIVVHGCESVSSPTTEHAEALSFLFCLEFYTPLFEKMEDTELRLLEIFKLMHTAFLSLENKQKLFAARVSDVVAKKEIELAKTIHERSLGVTPKLPKNVNSSSIIRATNQVGGDWFAIYAHPQLNFVNFYIGDVTGHGLDSAFVVSTVAGAVKMAERELEMGALKLPRERHLLAQTYLTDLYASLNLLVREATDSKQMTFAAGMLDIISGRLYFINAGHLPPLLINGAETTLVTPPHEPLGATAETKAEVAVYELLPMQAIFCYTDGLLENIKLSKKGVGTKKLHQTISQFFVNNLNLQNFKGTENLKNAETEELRTEAEVSKKEFSQLGEHIYTWSLTQQTALKSGSIQNPNSPAKPTLTTEQWTTKNQNREADDVAIMAIQWLGPPTPNNAST